MNLQKKRICLPVLKTERTDLPDVEPAKVAVASGGRSGNCLSVTGRTSTWNGAELNVTDSIVKGATYSISVWVKQTTGSDQKVKLSANLTVSGQK